MTTAEPITSPNHPVHDEALVKCHGCGAGVGEAWATYYKVLDSGYHRKAALDFVGVSKLCCRIALGSHSPYIQQAMSKRRKEIDTLTKNIVQKSKSAGGSQLEKDEAVAKVAFLKRLRT